MKLTIRELKSRLANFALHYDEKDDESKTDEQLLVEKCRIINEQFFGEDESKWLNAKKLLRLLYDIEDLDLNKDEQVAGAYKQLYSVLQYLTTTSGLRYTPKSFAVYDAAQILAPVIRNAMSGVWVKLRMAISDNDIPTIKKLIADGADVNTTSPDDNLPILTYAIREGAYDVAEFLIKAGADVNIADKHGFTALMMAGNRDNIELTKLLLDAGADVNAQTTPQRVSVLRQANGECFFSILAAGADANLSSKSGETAIFDKAKQGASDAVEALIKAGADVNIKAKHDITPLFVASEYGQYEPAKLLIEAGAEVNTTISDGRTPLIGAVSSGSLETVELLLDNGANTEACSDYEGTALIVAAKKKNADMVRLLLKHGADPDNSDSGETLAEAVCQLDRYDREDLIDVLRQYNIDFEDPDNYEEDENY